MTELAESAKMSLSIVLLLLPRVTSRCHAMQRRPQNHGRVIRYSKRRRFTSSGKTLQTCHSEGLPLARGISLCFCREHARTREIPRSARNDNVEGVKGNL